MWRVAALGKMETVLKVSGMALESGGCFYDVFGSGGGTFVLGRVTAFGKMETVLKAMNYFRIAGGVWGLLVRLLVG